MERKLINWISKMIMGYLDAPSPGLWTTLDNNNDWRQHEDESAEKRWKWKKVGKQNLYKKK